MEDLSKISINEETFLYDHFSLPALPTIVTQLKKCLSADDVDVSSVSRLLINDPALSAQILKVVNSAYYCIPRDITDIHFAVAYLGIQDIYRIVLSLSVINTLDIENSKYFNKLWHHSNYVALCSKNLAKRVAPHFALETLWPAALLHDIGKLVYLKFFPDYFKVLNRYCLKHGVLFHHAENYYNLPNSSHFGALLCDRWRLPEAIRYACSFHNFHVLKDFRGTADMGELISLVTLGNYIAIVAGGNLRTTIKEELAMTIQSYLNYSQKEFLAMMGEVYEMKHDVDGLM